MKKLITICAVFLMTASLWAQSPEKMSYQAVVRDASNTLVASSSVGMQISILQGSESGTAVYVETQSPSTNANGLVSLEIGSGTVVSGDFTTIDWSAGPYFIKTETDPTGGTSYTITGTSQLMSIPYALYAKTSGSSIPGPQGIQGIAGNDGADGAIGATGPIGPIGPSGPMGNDGATGPQGDQGIAGNDGADGSIGSTGPMGPMGNDGAIGATGPQGDQGIAGNDGADGATGPTGPTGSAGPTGPMGPMGPIGNDGAIGATGPQGDQGIAGNDGAIGATGPQGIQGIAGNDGADGAIGATGPTGSAGPIGPMGPMGPIGNDGAIGATGPQGDRGIAGNDGADGAIGPTGPMGPMGNDGAIGATGPMGPMGNDGAIGATGPQGIQGIAGNDGADGSIGATGPTGSAGPTGPMGPMGQIGNDGAIGATGPQGIQGPEGAEGHGGVTTAGANVTITGTGTTDSPYVITGAAGLSPGTAAGQMQYWNGTAWVTVATTQNEGATLQMIGGVPTWTGGTINVTNPTTGKVWMDRNLGASQVATSSTNASSYGDLYQWGRGSDGHQVRTSGTTATLSFIDSPAHGDFITNGSNPFDWRSPQNNNLWQGVSGTNNPCPAGYRLPTDAEWDAERLSWGSNNSTGAFTSPLKLSLAGFRSNSTGSLDNVGSYGLYWSSTIDGTNSRSLLFNNSTAYMFSDVRARGFSVRCLKN